MATMMRLTAGRADAELEAWVTAASPVTAMLHRHAARRHTG
jgi:hypothetical protein